MFNKGIKRITPYLYVLFRVLIGVLFMMHGLQKLFGVLGGKMMPLFGLIWFAGLVEFIGGIAIVVGFFTRLAALGSAIQMLVAYFMAHASKAWTPIANGGELAVLYFAAFLILFAFGARKFSLEKAMFKKEVF